MAVLEIKNLEKSYGKVKALHGIDLEVRQGEVYGFIGPNGAGKTTTIKMITGILHATQGKVMLDGLDVAKQPVEAKRTFTYVPDSTAIFDGIKGIDYINFIGNIYDVPLTIRKERCEQYTRAFDIHDALSKPISSYSHGMKQKLVISAALIPQPRLFILDEPMVGLDPKSARMMKDLMRDHARKGGTVFFSSQKNISIGLPVVKYAFLQ